MVDTETIKIVNTWKHHLLRIQKRGRESVNNPEDKSNGLYDWLDLKDVIDEMEIFAKQKPED